MIKRTQFILLILFLLSGFQETIAQTTSYLKNPLITDAITLFNREQYDSALTICQSIIDADSTNPMGYFGAAVIYYGTIRNYWTRYFEAEFDGLITIGIEKSEQMIEKCPNNAESYFMYGAGLGFRGMYKIKKGEWFSAFKDGLSGYRNLKKAYTLDDKLYDAYYGLGVFYYMKSVKAKVLTFLRLMKDEREKGIEFIKLSIEKGRFVPLEAQLELIKIYYEEGQYETALAECRIIEPEFHLNTGYQYVLANILDKRQLWEEAYSRYEIVIDNIFRSPYPKSNALLGTCYYGLANAEYHMEQNHNALINCYKAIDYFGNFDPDKEFTSSMVDIGDIQNATKDLLKKLQKATEINTEN
ncbi:hypothetical protein JW960_00385 [candidate division KSB1 bacterium]|nr:hypothetical protein [candidate division KSB1 bacterium]